MPIPDNRNLRSDAVRMKDRTLCRLAISLLVLAFCALALPLSSSSQPASKNARNLPVTKKLQRELRAAFVAKHKSSWLKAADIRGPIKGGTYYGRFRAREYAIAVFSVPTFGTRDQWEIFRRAVGRRWNDRGESGGSSICADMVPLQVLKVWKLTLHATEIIGDREILCYG